MTIGNKITKKDMHFGLQGRENSENYSKRKATLVKGTRATSELAGLESVPGGVEKHRWVIECLDFVTSRLGLGVLLVVLRDMTFLTLNFHDALGCFAFLSALVTK